LILQVEESISNVDIIGHWIGYQCSSLYTLYTTEFISVMGACSGVDLGRGDRGDTLSLK